MTRRRKTLLATPLPATWMSNVIIHNVYVKFYTDVIGLDPVDLTVEVTRCGTELTMEVLPTTKAIRELARVRRRQRLAAHRAKLQNRGTAALAGSRC